MPDELAIPSLLWTNSAAADDQPTLVRLTPTALTLAVVPKADLDKVTEELQAGGEVAGQVIPISAISGADGDEDGADLTVNYRTGPSKTASAAIDFGDQAKREEFLTALAGALGPGWARRKKPISRWKVAPWIALATMFVAALACLMYHEASLIAEGKPPLNWGKGRLKVAAAVAHWVERQIGATGVMIGGIILVSLGVGIFLVVVASPPRRVVLEPAEQA